jgi:hypothetical protein
MFGDAAAFVELVRALLSGGGPALAVAGTLGSRLAEYARPFDDARFAQGLRELAG